MKERSVGLLAWAVIALLNWPSASFAHFIWIRVEASTTPQSAPGAVRVFFNEAPHPEAPEFVKFVSELKPTADGVSLAARVGSESLDAPWVGVAPLMVDAESDLGVNARGGKAHRLYYTARAQTRPVAESTAEANAKLRVRLVEHDGKPMLQVLFDGKPVADARIKIYPESGEPEETKADASGLAAIEGLADGTAAVWANWNDKTSGELGGKAFEETRYYATLTYTPASESGDGVTATQFATMPEPSVNSFGGAVLDGWLYVYCGHVGRTHRYNTETTSPHFRRLNLSDGTTWEDLPNDQAVQGVALVSDGRYLYRTGGMAARNGKDEEHDLHSIADFARFDPQTKTWTALPAMPQPRSTHDSAIVGRTLYVCGGWTMKGASDESEFCTTSLAIDLDKPEAGWREIPQPFERRALAVAEANQKLYVVAGLVGGGMKVDRRVDVYDPSTGAWTQAPSLPGISKNEGFAPSAFSVAGRLYASGASGQILRLSKDGSVWEAIGAWAKPRITHRVLPGPSNTLMVVGGNNKGLQTPVIEVVPLPVEGPDALTAGK